MPPETNMGILCRDILEHQQLKVSERSVKDVLDWLVKNDLVIYQADKYQIAKREFMDISRRKALEKKRPKKMPKSGLWSMEHPYRLTR